MMEFVKGSSHIFTYTVSGVPPGVSVVGASWVLVTAPGHPALATVSIGQTLTTGGVIEDSGSGANRTAVLRFRLSQTALGMVPDAQKGYWCAVRVTYSNGDSSELITSREMVTVLPAITT